MRNKVWNQITRRAAAFAAAAVLALTPAVSALAPALTAYATGEGDTTEETTTSTTIPSSSDTAQVTISNVDPNLDSDGNATTVVTAYQIIEATYNAYGVTGYQLAEALTTASSTEDGTVYTVASLENGDTSVYVTAKEATTIAQAILNGTFTETTTDEDGNSTSSSLLTSVQLTYSSTSSDTSSSDSSSTGTYTGSLGAGTWIVLVTNTGTTVYNPIVVSNYYTNANDASTLQAGSVDASGNFEVNGTSYYAKKTTVELDKSIVTSSSDSDSDESSESGTTNGTSASVGDVVTFQISTTMPDYSSLYTSAMVSITDILSAGLTLSSSDGTNTFSNGTDNGSACAADWSYVTVTVGETTYSASTTTTDEDGNTTTTANFTVKAYTFSGTEEGASSYAGKTKMVISFDSDFILAHGGETIVITYYAVVNSSAATNADPNTNTAGITYTTEYELNENGTQDPGDPDDPTDPDEPDDSDTTYVYSFALEQDTQKVKIASSDEEDDTDEDDSSNNTSGDSSNDDTTDDTDSDDSDDASDDTVAYEALAGATFGLFSGYPTSTDESSGNLIATMTTKTSSDGDSDDSDDTSSDDTSDDSSDGNTTVSVGTDANGYITFSGLAEGTYYLQEITAPTGYALNETVYQVVISADIDSTTGILSSYTVTIAPVTSYDESAGTVTIDDDQKTTTTYNVTSSTSTDDDGNTTTTYTATPNTTDSSVNTQLIVNTSLITLPSTGGIGIYVIIAVSLAVVVICAVVVTRRKPDKDA